MHALKKTLYEQDICTQCLVPTLVQAGWDLHRQMREEITFTRDCVIVRGKRHSRDRARRADFSVYHQPNLPLAVIKAKVNTLPVGAGMQQMLDYADARWARPSCSVPTATAPAACRATTSSMPSIAASRHIAVLLRMATDTSKTYTALQIMWRLWRSGQKQRTQFLADRDILVDQLHNNDSKPFVANTFARGIQI